MAMHLATRTARTFWHRAQETSRVQRDFDCLLDRIEHRLYPETMPVLASYWLGTICVLGYTETEWKALDRLLQQACADRWASAAPAVQSLVDLRAWIRENQHKNRPPSLRSEPGTKEVGSDVLGIYLFRLLNEWLPVEAAQLLVKEAEDGSEAGIPAIVTARALEHLLVREHLSRATLEAALVPGLLSPRLAYPADSEILQDVVLFLLGRTGAPPPAKLPAVLLCVAPDAPLSWDYDEAVRGATLTADSSGAEELQVEIPPAETDELLQADPVRITSAVVTMDGQLWQADRLQRGERDSIVYRGTGRLRIDYSGEHARLVLPCSDAHGRWSGPVSFTNRLEIFGREWHISHWQQDSERTLLHLICVGSLPITAMEPDARTRLRRYHPAAIDMAWAALESALAASLVGSDSEPVEQLRRSEMVPLGRALFELAQAVMTRRLRQLDAIERRLQGVRYLSSQTLPLYGPVPWRILPEPVRKVLLAEHIYGPLAGLFHEVFQGLPDNRVPSHRLMGLWNRYTLRPGASRAA
jgi:hypothetical protein